MSQPETRPVSALNAFNCRACGRETSGFSFFRVSVSLVPAGCASKDSLALRYGCRFGVAVFCAALQRNVVAFQFAIKGGPADSQHFSCKGLVSTRLLKDPQNGHALHLGE